MDFYQYIGSQFSNPRGLAGRACCIIMNVMNRAMYQGILYSLDFKAVFRVLDIGYGNGYLIRNMYKKSKGHFYGIDISKDTLRAAGRKNKKGILERRVHLSVGDCCDLKYADEFFDAVTTVNTIYFWEDTSKGLSEIYRVLKKGGTFSNAFYSKEFLQKLKYTRQGFQYFEPEEIKVLAKKAGFSKIKIKTVSNGKGFIICCKK